MFWMAGKLYGLSFTHLENAPVVHPDVRAWSVERLNRPVGVFYFDPFARPGKRSGAWMNAYRSQQRLGGEVLPIVSNNCNFVKAAPGQPTLLSWDDAETLFHEFGHGLHGLLSQVIYPSLAGTNVARDYVEFPSQVHEHWLHTPEILKRFAIHADTGESLPEDLLSRLDEATTFGSGFATVEFLGSALLDMQLHLIDEDVDPEQFEEQALEKLGMPPEIIMRHRLPQFAHIFSSDGYSASYYCYLWADALTADAVEAFQDAPGGMYDRELATRLKELVLSRGNSIDPADAFKAFRGREVEIEPLLRERGFAPRRTE